MQSPFANKYLLKFFTAEFQTFDHLQLLEQGTYGLKVKLQIMSGKDWAYDKCEGTEGKILELTLPILSPLQPLFKWNPTSP